MTVNEKLTLDRANFLLSNRVHDPSYLLSLWKLSGSWSSYQIPKCEVVTPWWKGIFDED